MSDTSHNFIPGGGTKSPSNSNGHGNGHGLLTGELTSVDQIPSIQPWTEEELGTPNTSRGSQKGSSPVRSKKRKSGRVDDTQRLTSTAIEFSELKDGSLIDLVEDPENSNRALLAVSKDGETTYHSQLERDGKMFVPLAREGEVFQHVQLARLAEPYESVRGLLSSLVQLIEKCVDVKREYLAPLVHFVLFTWVADRLPVAPYLSIVGLPQSGKTTLLRVLSLVCRRPLLTADVTSAAFYEACSQLNPTLLIDESGTPGDNRALRHLLRIGTTRDVLVMRKTRIFHAYGPKVICWREPPDDPALSSRCVEIQMVESDRTNVYGANDLSVRELAAKLQAQLLQFRFENYRKISTPVIPGIERLKPRSREMLMSLAAPCAGDMETCGPLVEFFQMREIFSREPLPPPENAVLTALFSQIHQQAYNGALLINNLATKVNEILKASGERFRLSPRKVGAVMATLGFGWKKRTNRGWTILLERADQVRVHKLVDSHGMDLNIDRSLKVDFRDCPLCKGDSPRPELQSDPR
jgi:hypothetical protein